MANREGLDSMQGFFLKKNAKFVEKEKSYIAFKEKVQMWRGIYRLGLLAEPGPAHWRYSDVWIECLLTSI